MKKAIVFLSAVIGFTFCFSCLTQADELSGLNKQMKAMQKEMQVMQKKIEELEAERRVQPLEEGILSAEGVKLEIGGKIELDYVDTERDRQTDEPRPHFTLGDIELELDLTYNKYLSAKAEIEFGEHDEIDVDEIYLKIDNLPLDTEIKIGLDDMFIKPNRITERYPLAGTAFWKDEEWGIFVESKFYDPFYVNFSYSQGLELDDAKIGEDDSYRIIHADKRRGEFPHPKEVGMGLGADLDLDVSKLGFDLPSLGDLDVLVFCYLDQLSPFEKEWLFGEDADDETPIIPYYTDQKIEKYRYGINVDYDFYNFNFVGQFIRARDGSLDRYAWFMQPSYELTLPWNWKYYNTHTLLFRYGRLKLWGVGEWFTRSDSTAKALEESLQTLTWDREEMTFAIISELYKNIYLHIEYTINGEYTGENTGEVDNNELLVQLRMLF